VVALQGGEVIFSMSTSFHHGEEGPEFSVEHDTGLTAPEDVPEVDALLRFGQVLRIRPFPPTRPYRDGEQPVPSRMWARVPGSLPDDPIIHASVLTYLSDVGSGFADGAVPGAPRGGPTIDHALWFHHPIRLDDWVLLDTWPLKATGSRGLYAGSLRDRHGRLGALLNQEVLFRAPRGR
jgi:acyl-CoA thioesterase-2